MSSQYDTSSSFVSFHHLKWIIIHLVTNTNQHLIYSKNNRKKSKLFHIYDFVFSKSDEQDQFIAHKNTKPDELTRSSGNIFERIFEREENIFGREYELFRVAGRTRLWLLFAMGFVLLMWWSSVIPLMRQALRRSNFYSMSTLSQLSGLFEITCFVDVYNITIEN